MAINELSIFIDESGDMAGLSRYYLLTIVMHDQSKDVSEKIACYEESLANRNLPNFPFHSEPLLNGRGDYANLPIEIRKKLFYSFNVLVQRLPISYEVFVYKRSEVSKPCELLSRMSHDLKDFLLEHLEFFQKYDVIKVYYDNGQSVVKKALEESLNSILSKGVVHHRKTSMTDYRLEQVADYLCTIELAAVKYDAHEDGGTYNKFFGSVGAFKKNWLKQARRKHIKS